MRSLGLNSVCLVAFASASLAKIIPDSQILWGPGGKPTTVVKRQATTAATSTRVPDSACTNSAFSRQCWSNGFSAATDFDVKWPTTGRTVTYNLEIINGTCNPDGNGAKPCQLFNNVYPGPTISASTFPSSLTNPTMLTGFQIGGIQFKSP